MKNKILNSTIIQKEKNNEILLTSIVVAFGINILTTGVLGFFNLDKEYLLLIFLGLIFSLIVLLRYSILKIKKQNTKIEINGLIIYDEKENKIIDIPEYDISHHMINYLSAAFSENKALANKWKNGKIGTVYDTKEKNLNNGIVIELIEYSFLSTLSTLLDDYYNINNIRGEDIKSLSFDELPIPLRKNRFLKLFSEDMENRDAFFDSNDSDSNSNVVYAIGKNGALFDKFDLKLPKEVKIKKDSINKLEFLMKYFTLKIEYVFDGINTIVDSEFYEFYLNIERDFQRFSDFKFKIIISVEFNNKILLSRTKIQNYMWVDNFLNSLINSFDIDEFYNKIYWENNKSIMRCLNNIRKREVVRNEHKRKDTKVLKKTKLE